MLRTTFTSAAMTEGNFEILVEESEAGGFKVRLRDKESQRVFLTVTTTRNSERVFKSFSALVSFLRMQWPDQQEFVLRLSQGEATKGDSHEEHKT